MGVDSGVALIESQFVLDDGTPKWKAAAFAIGTVVWGLEVQAFCANVAP